MSLYPHARGPGTFGNQSTDVFRHRLSNALEELKKVLAVEKNPQYPGDVPHKYDDKYLLAEMATRAAMMAQLNVLNVITNGKLADQMDTLSTSARSSVVTLQFNIEEKCEFAKTVEKEITSEKKLKISETERDTGKTTDKVISSMTTVREHTWKYDMSWQLFAYAGTETEWERVNLASGEGGCDIVTTGEVPIPPCPKINRPPAKDVNFTWLLRRVKPRAQESKVAASQSKSGKMEVEFSIDRTDASCLTPRVNKEIEAAVKFFSAFEYWAKEIERHLTGTVFSHELRDKKVILSQAQDKSVFSPVLPLFSMENVDADDEARIYEVRNDDYALPESTLSRPSSRPVSPRRSPVLRSTDFHKCLDEQYRSLVEKMQSLEQVYSVDNDASKLVTARNVQCVTGLLHAITLCQEHRQVVDAIEALMYEQLIAAIGKHVTASDFGQYMRFHDASYFRDPYRPKAFSYAIRSVDQDPVGFISIEADDSSTQPIQTFVSAAADDGVHPMHFSLDASTNVTFFGKRYLHAYIRHEFGRESQSKPQDLLFNARARQFSSFIMLIGTISDSDTFLPTHAAIVQNKDEFQIPLKCSTIPTQKEFLDAIDSLSPEQQAFAKAFRKMQLASTVFAICVIMIKPALERVLNLPPTSLTKEIKLTQYLMEMFTKYHIGPGMIDFSGSKDEEMATKISVVKENADAIGLVIKDARDEELKQEKQESEKRYYTQNWALREVDGVAMQFSAPRPDESYMSEYGGARGTRQVAKLMGEGKGLFGGGNGERRVSARVAASACRDTASRELSVCDPWTDTRSAAGDEKRASAAERSEEAPKKGEERGQPERGDADEGRQELPNQEHEHLRQGGDQQPLEQIHRDYSKLPRMLDSRCGECTSTCAALRAMIIKPGDAWKKKSFDGLLDARKQGKTESLNSADELRSERSRAFDLLNALTKYGEIPLTEVQLHVVFGVAHEFEKTLMDTVVTGNVNPIEKVRQAHVLMSSVVHGLSDVAGGAREMIENGERV